MDSLLKMSLIVEVRKIIFPVFVTFHDRDCRCNGIQGLTAIAQDFISLYQDK